MKWSIGNKYKLNKDLDYINSDETKKGAEIIVIDYSVICDTDDIPYQIELFNGEIHWVAEDDLEL